MVSSATTSLIYIDTNEIVSAKEYDQHRGSIGDSSYRTRGRNCEELLNQCIKKNIRVATLKFTLAEMLNIYQRWHYAKTKLGEGVPLDEIIGNSSGELRHKFYTSTNLALVASNIDGWLASWPFRSLVELYPANNPNSSGSWSFEFWEITRIIFKYALISAPDCLHAAATVVAGADMFVSNDGGLNKAVNQLYDSPAFKEEAASVLGLRPVDISLQYGALRIQTALTVVKRL